MIGQPSSGKEILKQIVQKLKRITPGQPETYIGYKEVHDALGLELQGETYGDSLSRQGLGELAEWTKSNGYPAVTGLIVNQTSFKPGRGYFDLYGKREDDYPWWEEEVVKSLVFDWEQFLQEFPSTPAASDLSDVPQDRIKTSVYRILRDTALARKVKLIHNYECQLCGSYIQLADNSRYAEAHHIKSLGKPHNGPDIIGNILCLCPNHHAELDYGVIKLTYDDLVKQKSHAVERSFVEYHNAHIYKGQIE